MHRHGAVGTMGAMITLYLHGRAACDARTLESFLARARPVYEAPGGITVRLQWSLAEPGAFVEIMEYRDRVTYEADQVRVERDPAMRALIDEWHTLLAGAPRVEAYEDVTLDGGAADRVRRDRGDASRATGGGRGTAGGSLAVHRYGRPDRPTVLLLHGLTDAGTTWPDLIAHWGDAWDVHAPDLRGHGRSPRFCDDELGRAPEVMLADVLDLLDAQPGPVALVGHSLGGLLALRAALARPQQVSALVLEDPAKPDGTPTDDEDTAFVADPAIVASVESSLIATEHDRAAEVARMRRETPWSDTEIEAWADSRPLVDRRYVRRGLFLGQPGWEELFDALAVPTLLVLPPDAPMAPRPDLVHNPLVRRVVIEGAGHCVRRDQPAAYHAAVDAFLDEHARHHRARTDAC